MGQDNDTLGLAFGIAGNILALFFFLSPIVQLKQLISGQMNYKDMSALILVFALQNCLYWACVGLTERPSPKFLIYGVNLLGIAINYTQLTIYLYYFFEKNLSKTIIYAILLIGLCVGQFLPCYLTYYQNKDDPNDNKINEIVSQIAMYFNIIMFISPAEKLYTIIRTKNSSMVPIVTTCVQIVCGACWFVYGSIISKTAILIPNGIAIFIAILNLIAYFVYPKQAKMDLSKLNEQNNSFDYNKQNNEITSNSGSIQEDAKQREKNANQMV